MQPEFERVREREREAREPGHEQHEKRFLRWEEARQRIASLPRVIKYDQIPWRQNQQARVKSFVGSLFLDEFLAKGPTYTIAANEQVLPPGSKSGRHRHFEEAIFYVIEGKGWELHDGVEYPWEAGDVFCVPCYSVHQHNTYPDSSARLFFCISPVWSALGLGEQFVEFHDLHPQFGIPAGAEPLHGPGGELIGYRRPDGVEIQGCGTAVGEHAHGPYQMAGPSQGALGTKDLRGLRSGDPAGWTDGDAPSCRRRGAQDH